MVALHTECSKIYFGFVFNHSLVNFLVDHFFQFLSKATNPAEGGVCCKKENIFLLLVFYFIIPKNSKAFLLLFFLFCFLHRIYPC